ncbi:MAG: hypothetical protein IJ608_03305 [Lachnospiraceae bacterium]|nr:hypothetical protein [Lachnospiraceae bacterium]
MSAIKDLKENRTKKLAFCISIALMAVSLLVFFTMNRYVPFMMDDEWYATKLYNEEPVRGLSDIVDAQIWHYNNWGGRSITHGLLQLILIAGERTADVLNTLALMLLSAVTVFAAGIRLRDKNILFFIPAAAGLICGLNANLKMSMCWQAGAANYLYITVFIMAFLSMYLACIGDENAFSKFADKATGNVLLSILMLPLGLMAGWSNENMGPAVFVASIIAMAILIKNKKTPKLWMILGSFASCIGSVLVILAPGNFVRNAEITENSYGVLWRVFLRGYAESKAFLEYLFPTITVLVFILILAKTIPEIRLSVQDKLLLFTALLSFGAMALSPHYPDRATFGTMVLLISVIISVASKIIKKRGELFVPLCIPFILIWLKGMYVMGEFICISWGWIR